MTDTAPRDRVEVSAIADAVAASMSEHVEEAGVHLVVEGENDGVAEDFVVLGSASALRRAITSLVDNALAHQHTGGTITVRVGRHGRAVIIEVCDDRVGDPDAMETLFTRFSHGDSHTAIAGRRQRYGIGLALVREIAHAHGGDIAVTQSSGGGAAFTLTVPAAPAI
jgi:signal transduction histidine kinase